MKTSKKGPYNPLTSLHRLEFILQHKSDALLRDSIGVGFSQVQMMQALHRSVPISQRSLAQKLHQTEANISRQLKSLKKQGLVEINRHKKDRRQRQISLSGKGMKTYAQAEKILAAQHRQLLGLLDKNEVQSFDRAVKNILSNLD